MPKQAHDYKRIYKFIIVSQQKAELSEEDVRRQVERLPIKIKYHKIAMEQGETGNYHLQMYFEFTSPHSIESIIKAFGKDSNFWRHPKIIPAMNPDRADEYVGNTNFVREDGKSKGGKVYWCYSDGERYKSKESVGQAKRLKNTELLLEMKSHIEQGKDLNFLWQNYFVLMIRHWKSFEIYSMIQRKESGQIDEIKSIVDKEANDILEMQAHIKELEKQYEEMRTTWLKAARELQDMRIKHAEDKPF